MHDPTWHSGSFQHWPPMTSSMLFDDFQKNIWHPIRYRRRSSSRSSMCLHRSLLPSSINCWLPSIFLPGSRRRFSPLSWSGFRPGHSTKTAVLQVMSDVLQAVDHEILLQRLWVTFGILDTVHQWFQSYLCWVPCNSFCTLLIWYHWSKIAVFHHICTLITLRCTVFVDPSRSTHSGEALWVHRCRLQLDAGSQAADKFRQNRGPLVYNTPASTSNHCIVDRRCPGLSNFIRREPGHLHRCWSSDAGTISTNSFGMIHCSPLTASDLQLSTDGHVSIIDGRTDAIQT